MKEISKFIGLVVASSIIGYLFWQYPAIDIAAAKLFYNNQHGFFLKDNKVVIFLHGFVPYVVGAIITGCVLAFAVFAVKTKRILSKENIKVLYLLLVLAVGPGLIVNSLLKEHWERARPSQIEEFGGRKDFTPAFVIGDQCETNCSFVSGHASVGFFFLAFAFLFQRHRQKLLAFGVLFGSVLGVVRMIQGGHFLSDVIFSGVLVYITAYLLAKLMKVERD